MKKIEQLRQEPKVIKNVALWADKRIETTKKVIKEKSI